MKDLKKYIKSQCDIKPTEDVEPKEEKIDNTSSKKSTQKQSVKELHKLFSNPDIDLNATVVKLIDQYCKSGGKVAYEVNDELCHEYNVKEDVKIETACVDVPEADIRYTADVYKHPGKDAYCIHIYNDYTAIYIFGEEMKNIEESIKEGLLFEEGAQTELNTYIKNILEQAIETGKPVDELIDEGIFSGLLGGLAGATVGASIMKAVCHALGIDERGALGSLLTSRAVMGAVGATLGYRI